MIPCLMGTHQSRTIRRATTTTTTTLDAIRAHRLRLPTASSGMMLFTTALWILLVAAADAKIDYPTLNISLLDYSTSFRQSVCDRQLAINNGTLEFRDGLEGMRLNVALSQGVFGGLDPDGTIPEQEPKLDVRIMDELAIRAGFAWRESFAAVMPPSNNSSITFDEILEWSVETFDVSAIGWTRTRDRINRGTAFPQGFVDGSIILVGRAPKADGRKSLNLWSFLLPFSWECWLLIALTFVISGLIYFWMERTNHNSDRQELESQPIETIFFSALTFIGDIKFQPSTNYARLFVFTLALWSLLISSAYTANLASFLSMQSAPQWDIETVEDAVRLQVPMCAMTSAAPALLVQGKFPSANLVLINSFERGSAAAYEALFAGQCRLVLTTVTDWEKDRRNPVINPSCDLQWVGRVFRFLSAGFATRSDSGILCTSLIRDILNLHLIEMDEDGFVEDATRKVLEMGGQGACTSGSSGNADGSSSSSTTSSDGTSTGNEEPQLTVQNLGGLFILLYSVIAVTVLMAIWSKRTQLKEDKNKHLEVQLQHDLALVDEAIPERGVEGAPTISTTRRRGGDDQNTMGSNIPETLSLLSDKKLEDMSRELETIKEMITHLSNSKKNE